MKQPRSLTLYCKVNVGQEKLNQGDATTRQRGERGSAGQRSVGDQRFERREVSGVQSAKLLSANSPPGEGQGGNSSKRSSRIERMNPRWRMVTQVSNLLYRRIPLGGPSAKPCTRAFPKGSGLEIRDTAGWETCTTGVHGEGKRPVQPRSVPPQAKHSGRLDRCLVVRMLARTSV
jgi:hypothetical protein